MNFHQLLIIFFLLLYVSYFFSEHKSMNEWPNLMLQSTLVGWRAHVILKAQCSDFVGSSQHFGSEWFGNFGRNSFYTYSAGENIFHGNYFVQVWLYWFPCTHTFMLNTEIITEYRRQHGNSINWTIQRKL